MSEHLCVCSMYVCIRHALRAVTVRIHIRHATLVIHCDYDAQAVVVEPVTAQIINRIRLLTANSHAVLFHVGSHSRLVEC